MTGVLAFGDDRSDGAEHCWDWIVSHRWDGWRLEVITAAPPADMHPVEPTETTLHPWQPAEPRAAEDRGFIAVEHLRAEIDPRLALISRQWDTVAIGPRGGGIFKTLHLGSTADWLLRQPASPLLVTRQPGPVRRVLVASDGSAHTKRAVETLASFPWLDGVSALVVAVEDGQVDTEASVKDAMAVLAAADADVDQVTRGGLPPAQAIVKEIEKVEPDLVVMGGHGRGGVKDLVVGTTLAAIAGTIDRTILIAHGADD